MSADLIIVVVEDNELLREEMVSFLTRPGWRAHGADCGEALSDWLRDHAPDIAVLDVNLPYEDGYSIATRLRESHPGMGIVMLTARVRHADRASGYLSGADVYLTKPTNTAELIAVIENLSRRVRREAPSQFVLDRAGTTLTSPAGSRCLLTQSELRLVELLALAPGREADLEYLLAAMIGRDERPVTAAALAVLISRLRGKCQQALGVDNLVIAQRGVGYRLSVPVRLG